MKSEKSEAPFKAKVFSLHKCNKSFLCQANEFTCALGFRPFSAEGYSEMGTENQMSTEIHGYSEIIQAPVLIYNVFSSQNPQFPYMKKPNPPIKISKKWYKKMSNRGKKQKTECPCLKATANY